jgi:hypothetical protein
MVSLMLAFGLDFNVVVISAFDRLQAAIFAAVGTGVLVAGLWFVMPLVIKKMSLSGTTTTKAMAELAGSAF